MIERPVEYNSLIFNSRAASDLNIAPHYWINLKSVDGYYGEEVLYESHPIPCGAGERSGTPRRTGKQLTLSGEIWAANLAALRIAEETMQQAFWDLGGAAGHRLFHTTWNLYVLDPTARIYWTMKVNQPLVIVDQITGPQMMQSWSVGLRADDPRLYKESDNTLYHVWQV